MGNVFEDTKMSLKTGLQQVRESRINELQSKADVLQEKSERIKSKIDVHSDALEYHQSKSFIRKVFTFAWFSIWWNNRKLKKFGHRRQKVDSSGNPMFDPVTGDPVYEYSGGKFSEWQAHKKMLLTKQKRAHDLFVRKYGREPLTLDWNYKKIVMSERGLPTFANTYGNTKEERKIERQCQRKKSDNMAEYLQEPSQLASAKVKVGKYMQYYKHFNSVDRTIEVNVDPSVTINPQTINNPDGTTTTKSDKKVVVKLNPQGEIDLSLPENKDKVTDELKLAEILKNHPEAYSTIPASYFGAGVDRTKALAALQIGLKNKIAAAKTAEDGRVVVDSPERDETIPDKEYTGRSASPRDLAQRIYQDVIKKDKEINKEAAGTIAADKLTDMTVAKNANNRKNRNVVGDSEVDAFFNAAK